MAGIASSSAAHEQQGQQPNVARTPRAISFAIRPSHVRTLLWLRWKLTLRGYTRNTRRIVGLVFMLVFFVPVLGGLALATFFGYTQLSQNAAIQLLFLVIAGLYLIWAALPLLSYSVNEGLDVTKLQIYPLTRGEQMVSLVLATLLDVSTLFIAFFYVAILLAWHATPLAAIITALALIVAYVHTVGFSQLILAVLMGLLRTRRYRDVTLIIFALFGVACSLSGQLAGRIFTYVPGSDIANQIAQSHVEQYVHWAPPGMAAQAIVLANSGDYAPALLWLGGSLLLIPLMLALWAWVLDRGITTAETADAGAKTRRRRGVQPAVAGRGAGAVTAGVSGAAATAAAPAIPATSATPQRRVWRPISGAAQAIVSKDMRYLWRDPQYKVALMGMIVPVILVLFPNIFYGYGQRASSGSILGDASVLLAPLPALLLVYSFSINSLGMDRQGLQTLFLFPVRPLDVFWGKNLFAGGLAMAGVTILTLIKGAMTGGWGYVPLALCVGLAAVLLTLGCGNVTSVLFPFRMRQMRMGETSSMSSENGCLRGIISMTVLMVVAILLLPVAAAVVLPLLLGHNEWFIVTVPLALLYGIAFHQIATRLIAPVLLRRAPEILAVTVREA